MEENRIKTFGTVGELIDALKQYPADMPVRINYEEFANRDVAGIKVEDGTVYIVAEDI
jgi:hypothetical protein